MQSLVPAFAGVIAAAVFAATPAHAQDKNLARNLSAQCANCHGTNGVAKDAIVGLAGRDKNYLIEQMKAFKEGKRTGPAATIMHQIAKGYTDEQIALMADFFSKQKAQ
jgi:cytochrome subunit of sulfide dehydrogenase